MLTIRPSLTADIAEPVTVPAMLPVLSKTPGSTKWAGPDLGQHTREVLSELLNVSEEEYSQLLANKIV